MRAYAKAALAAALAGLVAPALAFDTGHHVDLTAAVLREHGFGDPAIRAAQVSNWLTDYYAVSPTSREAVRKALLKLHFDNLYDNRQVSDYWGWLVHDGQSALTRAAQSEDPAAALTTLGLLLHAVQDFYAHSNWVETHPRADGAPYRRDTWLSAGPPANLELLSVTYAPYPAPPPPGAPEHGGYDSGLNKDSIVRPLWDEAYVFAYCASHETLALARQWIESARPGWWDALQQLRLDETEQKHLDDDFRAARQLSMWVKGKGADGHWKGDQSGSVRYMSKRSMVWAPARGSIVLEQIKKEHVYEPLTAHLYAAESPPPLPDVAAFEGLRRAILVRTTYVEELRRGGGRVDALSKADFYEVVRIGGQEYVDRTLRKKRRYEDPWLTLHLVEAGEAEIPIRIEVWDEDAAMPGKTDECDLHPAAHRAFLSLSLRLADAYLTGDVEGRHDTRESAFETAGSPPDKRGVTIRAFVSARALAGP